MTPHELRQLKAQWPELTVGIELGSRHVSLQRWPNTCIFREFTANSVNKVIEVCKQLNIPCCVWRA